MSTSITDAMSPSIQAMQAIFSALDGENAMLGGYSLLDILLAFVFLALTLEFIFSMFDIDVDIWDHIFGESACIDQYDDDDCTPYVDSVDSDDSDEEYGPAIYRN